MTRQARLPVMITKFGNLMITAQPCLLPYHHDPGVSGQSCLNRAPSTDYAKAVGSVVCRPGPAGASAWPDQADRMIVVPDQAACLAAA
jgi:hypothetical protein